MRKVYISIDLGGTKCAGAIISDNGELLDKIKEKISGFAGDDVRLSVQSIISRLRKKLSVEDLLQGVGVSVPGISNQKAGTVWAPNIPGWDHYPLHLKLREFLGPGVPIHVDSDRACCICGEAWKGVARGYQDVIFLAFGTGIGAGILVDGKVLRGADDIAGAIGWLALDEQYPAGYKQFGCFEYNASGDGLARLAQDIYERETPATSLDPVKVTAEAIFEAYEKDDPLAKTTLHSAIDYWAKGVANLVSIFNPQMIIFGGGVFGPGLKFLNRIYEQSRKWAQPISIQNVKLVGGELGENAQLIGAASLVMNKGGI